ncbi:MAG: inositol monophosphatase [Patescibacteria group bacterium]
MLKVDPEKVENIIREVADTIIVPRFKNLQSHEIHFKSGDDPVTSVDKEAESALEERLLDLLPHSKVVGEEAFDLDSGLLGSFSSDSPVWIVDPIDGTKSFISGDPFYGVIVALAEQDQTIAAWLYDPTSREFVTAEKGSGAYHAGRKLSVLPPDDLPKMSGMMGLKIVEAYEASDPAARADKPILQKMLSSCHDYARLVVDVPHFSRSATQMHFHSWLSTCTPWDSAAGILINTEAGGYTAHLNGEPFKPSHYGRGILTAPDKESWRVLHDWIASFCAGKTGIK